MNIAPLQDTAQTAAAPVKLLATAEKKAVATEGSKREGHLTWQRVCGAIFIASSVAILGVTIFPATSLPQDKDCTAAIVLFALGMWLLLCKQDLRRSPEDDGSEDILWWLQEEPDEAPEPEMELEIEDSAFAPLPVEQGGPSGAPPLTNSLRMGEDADERAQSDVE